MNWIEFKRQVCNLNKSRIHKVNNSIGVYDAYKWIRKNKWLNIPRPVTEHEFYSIIRSVNKHLIESMLEGHSINFPYRMGKLELRKFDASIKFINGKLKTNLPIDWNKTLKLWSEDEYAYNKKTLIRIEEKELYKVCYDKRTANYNNKSFYSLQVNRELKKRIKTEIKEHKLDAFKI